MLVYKVFGSEWEKDPTVLKKMTLEELLEKIPRLQSQINALLNSRSCKEHINNSIVVNGFGLLLYDSKILYRALNYGVICLLEQYFTLTKPHASKALEIYKLFTRETDGMTQFFEIMKRFMKNDPPTLQTAPPTLLEALENYIRELEEGKTSGPNNNNNRVQRQQLTSHFVQQTTKDLFGFDQEDQIHNEHDDEDDDDAQIEKEEKDLQKRMQAQPRSPASTTPNNNNNNNFTSDPFGDVRNIMESLINFSLQKKKKIQSLFIIDILFPVIRQHFAHRSNYLSNSALNPYWSSSNLHKFIGF